MAESNDDSVTQAAPAIEAAAPPPPPTRGRRALIAALRLLMWGLGLAALGLAGVVALFLYYGRELPDFEKLTDYRPPQVTRVHDRHGVPIAEFFHERRTVVPIEKIPRVLKQAVLAAEDANFYEHAGLDYLGIVRAVLMDVRHMKLAQGASTITQQVVKNMVLSSERSIARKVKEAILARRLEQNLSKDEILFLYLNHIYFGHHRYGVEEAARFYFGKSVDQLSLGEAAVLAGLPQSPGRLSPLRDPQKSKARQTYVLGRMAENGFITRAQADAEIKRPILVAKDAFEPVGPYYAEEVRKQLVERYGEQVVYAGGLRVEIGMDRAMQKLADASLRSGLEEVDRRFGYRAPAVSVDEKLMNEARPKLAEMLQKRLPTRESGSRPETVWDFASVDAERAKRADTLVGAVDIRALDVGMVLVAPVVSVGKDEVTVDLGGRRGVIPFESMKWARKYSPGKWTAAPKEPADVLAPGQLARVKVKAVPPKPDRVAAGKPAAGDEPLQLELDQVPLVQGALVVIDPATRDVVALSGGYDFSRSAFNRATQARRQPGSVFKPFVYAAALASGKFTTASILNDAPETIRDPWTGKAWRPQNYEKDVFDGPMMLREALARSKNTISVRLIKSVGPQAVIDMARRAGINSDLPENLTLALGTGEVTPLELTNSYATLATLGQRADPVLIRRVTDPDGKVLEEHRPSPEETIPPTVAFITTSLMQSVVEMGTATRARELGREVAGKTGTASGHRDAWFAGYTPSLVATSWVGFDDHSPIGRSETGGGASLPIWLGFMREALKDAPRETFTAPPGIEQVRIDPSTGHRSAEGAPGRLELFVEGTAPQEIAVRPGEANPGLLFLEDGGGAIR